MRVVDRKTFLTLPEGTIFCKGVQWAFESLCIKGESLGNDWLDLDPTWVGAKDGGEASERLDEMLVFGASYPMEEAYGRDGCFDDSDVFLVFERDDLVKLREHLDRAINLPALS
jgi:hypothetical protein